MDEDSAEKQLYVCLPKHADSEGLVITVGGGPWQSEVSWTLKGPCVTATEDFQCLDADAGEGDAKVAFEGGAPYEEIEGCDASFTPVPTPLEDDIPDDGGSAMCPADMDKYLVGLHDSYGDGSVSVVLSYPMCSLSVRQRSFSHHGYEKLQMQ